MNKIQSIIKESLLNNHPTYQKMTPAQLDRETAALAKMTLSEMEALQEVGASRAEAQSEAIQTILKHQA